MKSARTIPFRAPVVVLCLLVAQFAHAQPLVANAGPNSVTMCSNASVTLGGNPTASGGDGPYSYQWSPAAGLSDPNVANPVSTVNSTTVYTVTVTDDNGDVDTDNITVNVNPAPDAGLVVQSPAIQSIFNGLVTFSLCDPALSWDFSVNDQSSGVTPGSTLNVDWGDATPDFNPGTGGWSTNHVYAQGLHTITYTITDPNGCVDVEQFQVFLGTNPGGGISTDPNTNICTGGSLPFYLNNVSTNTLGTTYLIDFGDGTDTLLNQPPPAVIWHTYNVSSCPGGSFTVSFVAQNPCDQTNGQISPIRVSQTPVVDFTMSPNDTACVNSTVTFTDASLGLQAPACTPPKHLWSITPGTYMIASGVLGSTNGQPGNPGLWTTGSTSLGIQFTQPGTYTITDVTGNVCGFDTLSRTICIESPPVPVFTLSPNAGCVPMVSTVDNTSSSPNSCYTRYQWQVNFLSGICGSAGNWAFSGGTNATSFEPQITFSSAGNYQVQLQAINSCGTFNATLGASVAAPPQVQIYTVGPICIGDSIYPTAAYQPCGTPITGYSWSTVGGSPASASTASPGDINYYTQGNYTVSVTAQSACGNTTISTPLIVNTIPTTANASVVQDTVCTGGTIQLQATTIPGAYYIWTGPNGFNQNSQNPVIINVNTAASGTYTVTAYLGVCDGPVSSVNVVVLPAPNLTILPANPSICNGDSVQLTVSGGSNYTWSIGGSNIGTGASIWVDPSATTTYDVVGASSGCPGTESATVIVNQPTPVVMPAAPMFCDQAINEFLSAQPAGGVWSGANIVTLTPGGTLTPIPGNTGVDVLTYTYTNAQGCVSTGQLTVTITPVPGPANAGPDSLVCEGAPVIMLSGAPNGGTWSAPAVGNTFNPVSDGVFNITYSYGSGSCATSDVMTVTVTNTPTVSAGADMNVCENAAVQNLNTGTPLGGTWSGTGVIGGGPYQFDPAIAAPSNVLTYTWSDGNGCTNSDQLIANVVPPPVASAGPDTTLCDQSIAYPVPGSPGGGVWSGPAPFFTSPPAIFTPQPGVLGSWVISYAYTDASGCSDTATATITVVDLTVIADAGNDTNVCFNGGPVQLTASPANGSWTPTAFLTATGVFDAATAGIGAHNITFCVGAGTCLSCDDRVVTVVAQPVVNAGPDLGFCEYEPVQDLTENPSGGTWSGTGIVDAALGWFDPGAAVQGANVLTYTYTDPNTQCTSSDQAVIDVNPEPVAAFTNAPIACQNTAFAPNDLSTGNTAWQWDFGDNTPIDPSPFPVHTYADTGTFTITLVVSTGSNCTDTISGSVTVWPSPTVDFDMDQTDGCGPLVVNFTNNSAGPAIDYTWDFGYGAGSSAQFPPAVIYPAGIIGDTTYVITLTGSNFCGTFTVTDSVIVHPDPWALFGPDFNTGCSPWAPTFSNVSVGQADTFEWLWGDGTSTITNDSILTHTYYTDSVSTTYTITLIATNACGVDSATYDIVVQPNSITAFFNTDTTQGCAPLTVNFTQYSIGVTNWSWAFGDGNFGLGYDATHTYTDPGTYTATLFGDNGCSYDTVSVQIEVLPSPIVNFTWQPDSVCAGHELQFINLTQDIAGLEWNFGDGQTSDLTNPTHTYATSGTYDVTLWVQSSLNVCTAELTMPVQVKVTPEASFTLTPQSGCIPLDVQFTNTSTDAQFAQWNFGDGNTSGNISPLHTYADDGIWTIQLVAQNLNGCTDTAYGQVTSFPWPESSFTFALDQSCFSPVDVQFTNTSQGAIGYTWTFGNGQGSDLVDPTATYDEPGTFEIELVSVNQYGCTDTSLASFTVYPSPLAMFEPDPQPGCAGYPIIFNNLSENSDAWHWDFGDGSGTSEPSPSHTYADDGLYTIELIAYGAGGCTDTLTAVDGIVVNPSPTAAFSYDTLMSLSNALQFNNLSEGSIEWVWHFGDTDSSTAFEPLHLFPAGPENGYAVCLVATNSFGCPDTICEWVSVPSDPNIYAPNAFTPDADGVNEMWMPVLDGFQDWRYRLFIFDRWGEVIWETRDRWQPWDGNSQGIQCKTNVYVWKVILNRDGDERAYIGHVTLVRGDE